MSGSVLVEAPAHVRGSTRQRVLACISCQQRKVRCDRKFPCAFCVKSRIQCVPATLAPRQRRRRFSERALLDRILSYERLLRQNKIPFQPLHSAKEEHAPGGDISDDSEEEQISKETPTLPLSPSVEKSAKSRPGVKNVFHAMSQAFRDPADDSDSSDDDLRLTLVKQAWDQEAEDDQHLLFGGSLSRSTTLSALHPGPVQIFKLWQVFIDNVNPLLKIVHVQSLQPRIIEATSNIAIINPTFEALLFSVYCIAISTLTTEDCQTAFGLSKKCLSSTYQSGCRQALWNCDFLRTSDRDCLTALYLYLFSIKSSTSPQTLSSMLAIAIRISQRMGLPNELALVKCSSFEAEMRRRLWWALMFFDARIGILAGTNTVTLDPTWDCKMPLNLNDADLRLNMKSLPVGRKEPTDAVFAVVRCELGGYIRHAAFHLHLVNPAVRAIAKHFHKSLAPSSDHLDELEKSIEDRYLKFCDQENPLHFMAIWTTRTQLAKLRLMEHNMKITSSSANRKAAQYDSAATSAIKMLQCDAKIMTSPLAKGFVWWNQINFPFAAYYHLTQDISMRPLSEYSHAAWKAMSDNWDAWFNIHFTTESPIFLLLPKIALQAWDTYSAASEKSGESREPPRIVLSIQAALAQKADAEIAGTTGSNSAELGDSEFPMPTQIPERFANEMDYEAGSYDAYEWTNSGTNLLSDLDLNQLNWTTNAGDVR